MNLEKELRLQMDIYESGVQAEIVREEGRIKMRRVPTPGLPVREPMRQAEPQDKGVAGALADIPVAAAGMAKGAVEGTAGLPGDIYALGKGLYSAAFPEEGETRSEAFGRAIDEASQKFGAEAVRSIIDPVLLPMARKAGMSEEDIQLLQQGADVGQFVEVPGVGLAVRAGVKAAPGMARKAGDVVEGMGEAAKARMGEGGVELGSGVNPDPAIAAAGDVVAKFRAPKENEPGIIAFHGSGADFDEFKLEKIGTGEGAQAYGYGLYFTDSEDIARFYRNSVGRVDRYAKPEFDTMAGGLVEELGFDLTGGQRTLSSADPDYEYYINQLDDNAINKTTDLTNKSKTWQFSDGSELTLETDEVPTFNGKPLDSVYTQDVEERFGNDIKRIAEEARKFGIKDTVGTLEDDISMIIANLGQGLGSKRDMRAAVENLAPSGPMGPPSRYKTIYTYFIEPNVDFNNVDYLTVAGRPKGKIYKVGLAPKPDELLDYDVPLDQQPRVVQKLIKNLVGDLLVGDPEHYDRFDFRALAAIKGESPTKGYSPTGEDILTDLQRFLELSPNQTRRASMEASEFLYDFGIPGIKYRAAGSRGAGVDDAAAKRNYVIFDDKMIKILEKYGIAGPVAITGIAASQEEGKGDGKAA